jgi:hypothetical protein
VPTHGFYVFCVIIAIKSDYFTANFNPLVLVMEWHYVFREVETEFLGSFAKLRKAGIALCLSAGPFVCNNSDSTGRIFMKFDV